MTKYRNIDPNEGMGKENLEDIQRTEIGDTRIDQKVGLLHVRTKRRWKYVRRIE